MRDYGGPTISIENCFYFLYENCFLYMRERTRKKTMNFSSSISNIDAISGSTRPYVVRLQNSVDVVEIRRNSKTQVNM